jgi:DNA helicase-2/ATP-dependent DNA helicase PcrA
MLVVVPEKGLALLSQKLLAGLGLGAVAVTTFDDWIRRQARTLCRDLPKRACDVTPSRVSRFKRHPAVLEVLDAFVKRREAEIVERLRRRLPEAETVADQFAQARGPNLMAKLIQVEKLWAPSGENDPYDARREILAGVVREELDREKDRLEALAADRVDLFADREVLERIAAASEGELTPGMVDEVLAHSRDQFGETAEQRYADIDAHRLATVDGKAIDEDTPEDKAGTIDVEDYAVLLELLRRKVGRIHTSAGKLALYAHMVVDEAQDMAPVELAVLGQALRPDASVTIAGDAAQQIDPASCFDSWARVLGTMGVATGAQTHFLKTTYRSARPIADYAHGILGPLAPREAPIALREGAPVERSDFPNEGHAAVFLTEALTDLMDREPAASVAVVARNAAAARRFFETLRIVPRTRLVLAGEFPFTAGIDVTDVYQVKGLEWDYVVIPDAHVNAYPDNPESRRILHVAATRAIHQLWVVTVGKASPILPTS